jgi:hypothetical protein
MRNESKHGRETQKQQQQQWSWLQTLFHHRCLLQSHEILFCWAFFLSFFLFFAFENENIKNNWIQICEIWKWNLNKNIIRRM